ncbi:peroxiredoxin family protein [Peribacillus sp. SCS-155]|uniref:peroxiredoxin family protein n=1 Tax=Peribacillus sedimenti TaxID=3115297 RepID=UPI00390599F6
MFKKILAAVALIMLSAIAIVQAIQPDKETAAVNKADDPGGLTVGVKAPDFTLVNLNGQKVKLSDYRGKKVLLNFWATWCPPCKKEMPDLEKLHTTSGEDIVVLAVNDDPQNDVKGFAQDLNLTFPILLDNEKASESVTEAYQVMSLPTSFFIDKNGVIQDKFVGAMTYEYMQENLNKIK